MYIYNKKIFISFAFSILQGMTMSPYTQTDDHNNEIDQTKTENEGFEKVLIVAKGWGGQSKCFLSTSIP